ncbi:MAG: NAD-binding protein [Fidelibacterota bacterium]|nr:MAG: NAD-binding protein [Candidatus Neomarinimicrobiota bacterium]
MKDELAKLVKEKPPEDRERLGTPVAIIGAGTNGTLMAQTIAAHGHDTLLVEVNPQLIGQVPKDLEANMDREIRRWGMTQSEKKSILGRIAISPSLEDARKSHFVMEAIPESLEAKQNLFLQLDRNCPWETIFLSNTSILSLTEIASVLPEHRQERVIGLHFLNPAPRIPLVEIVRGMKTSDATFGEVKDFAESLGKTAVEVFEYPGYVTTRIILPMLNEAMHVVMEGVATAEDIDTAMKLGFDLPMGPLALADQIGLDEVLNSLQVLFHELGDLKYRPCPILKKMVRAGNLGVKTGKGFFEYETEETDSTHWAL